MPTPNTEGLEGRHSPVPPCLPGNHQARTQTPSWLCFSSFFLPPQEDDSTKSSPREPITPKQIPASPACNLEPKCSQGQRKPPPGLVWGIGCGSPTGQHVSSSNVPAFPSSGSCPGPAWESRPVLTPGPHRFWSSDPGCLAVSVSHPSFTGPSILGASSLWCGRKSSEDQKIPKSRFSRWPWTSHFISQSLFCK